MRSPLHPLFPLTVMVALLLASSLAAQSPAGNSGSSSAAKDDCTISGLVIKQGTNEPLKSARVQLRGADDASISTTVVTDTAGAFEFKGIKPGRYNLEVFRIGFVSQKYGQRTSAQPGAILTLTSGQNMHDLLFRLVPTAVISGRIQNEDGEPLPWANATAYLEAYSNGKLTLDTRQSVTTNDRGEYRLFDLPPGRYLVSATYHTGTTNRSATGFMSRDFEDEKGYVPIFYPGSTNSAKAQKIIVRAGEEVPSIDFILQEVTTYRIQGRVVYAGVTSAAKKSSNISLQLMPRDTENAIFDYSLNRTVEKAGGAFEILGVLPGAYVLFAQMFGENERHSAAQNIDVGNANVEGLQIVMTPGTPISGHVHWDGSPASQEQDIHLVLENVDPGLYGGHTTVLSDGSFNFKEVNDGNYRVVSWGLSPDCYLANVSYGGLDSAKGEIKVRHAADTSLEITYNSRGARVQGTVSDSDGLPSAGVYVVLVPDKTSRDDPRLYKSVESDQRGQFTIRGIRPGEYKLFSWQEVEEGAWQDPDFLKPFEDQGQTVTVQAGDTKSVSLVTIQTASTDTPKP